MWSWACPSSPLSPSVITLRPEASDFTPLGGAENALDLEKPSHKLRTVPSPVCPCHMHHSLQIQTPGRRLRALPRFHCFSLAPSLVIVVEMSWLTKEVSPPGSREMLLYTSRSASTSHTQDTLCSPFFQAVIPWPGLSSLRVWTRLHVPRLCLNWGLKSLAINPTINNGSTGQGVKLTDGIWVTTSASWWHDLGGRLLSL